MEYGETQMSVDWLESKIQNYLATYGTISPKMISIFAEQAKAMHKQECVDLLNYHNDIFDTSEEHYNKTFGGNNEQAMIDYNKMEEESEIDNYNEMNNE